MSSRREFLLGGLAGGAAAAVTALPAAGAWLAQRAAQPARAAAAVPPYRIIVDRRFAVTRGLLDAANAAGLAVSGIDGDVTDVWFNDLALRWRLGPAPIAGLTTVGALFCLERLAWDAGMRLQLRIDHRCFADGRVEHLLQAPAALLPETDVLRLARADWARTLLPLLTRGDLAAGGARSERSIAGAPDSFPAGHTEWLVSWFLGAKSARRGNAA